MKSWLKAQHLENKDRGIWSHHFMVCLETISNEYSFNICKTERAPMEKKVDEVYGLGTHRREYLTRLMIKKKKDDYQYR